MLNIIVALATNAIHQSRGNKTLNSIGCSVAKALTVACHVIPRSRRLVDVESLQMSEIPRPGLVFATPT